MYFTCTDKRITRVTFGKATFESQRNIFEFKRGESNYTLWNGTVSVNAFNFMLHIRWKTSV